MIFEFLVAYQRDQDTEILSVVRDCLAKVLEDNLNEFDDYAVASMVLPRTERVSNKADGSGMDIPRRGLFGFGVDLPDDTSSLRIVVDEFADALNTSPVTHVLKFEDPLLFEQMAVWIAEISGLEMKLRRVLSLVYLHAYQHGDPYDLLCEEVSQPLAKERPTVSQMKARHENQFFHLTFSQYVGLNRRPDFKLSEVLELIREREAFESLREEVLRSPVQDEDDAQLLAGLKERMDAVETMRNCCAHSRRPSSKVEENYINARPLLDRLLDGYLARWEWQAPDLEMPWDRKAREAVEDVLARADWNNQQRTITFYDRDDDRMRETFASRDGLHQYLCAAATSAFYANAPRDDGECLYRCDDDGIVWTALEPLEDRLTEFFGPEN